MAGESQDLTTSDYAILGTILAVVLGLIYLIGFRRKRKDGGMITMAPILVDKNVEEELQPSVVPISELKKDVRKKLKDVHHHQHTQQPSHPLKLNTIKGHADVVTGIRFSHDAHSLATACGDGAVRIFKLEDDASAPSFKVFRVNMPLGVTPLAVAFGPPSPSSAPPFPLVISGYDVSGASLMMYQQEQRQNAAAEAPQKLPPPSLVWDKRKIHGSRAVLCLSSPQALVEEAGRGGGGDGDLVPLPPVVATCSEATDVKLWQVSDGACIDTVDSNQLKNAMCALSPKGRFLAIAAFTADVKIWEVVCAKDGKFSSVDKVMQLKGHKGAITWLSFLWDEKGIITASKDGTLKVWNLDVRYRQQEDPKCVATFSISNALLSERGQGREEASHIEKDGGGGKGDRSSPLFDRIAVSPDGNFLAASFLGQHLCWLDLRQALSSASKAPNKIVTDGNLLEDVALYAHEGNITCMEWSPKPLKTGSGSEMCYVLATAGEDKKVKLWRHPEAVESS